MSRTTLFADSLSNLLDQVLRKLSPWLHEKEKHDSFIGIARSALTNTNAVLDVVGEKGFNHIVDFCTAEAYTRGIQDTVSTAEEVYTICFGVNHDIVTVSPDICENISFLILGEEGIDLLSKRA
jgi:hypothetical protein